MSYMQVQQKDYWLSTSRGFRAIGILGSIALVFLIIVLLNVLSASVGKPIIYDAWIQVIVGVLAVTFFFVSASLFKRKSEKAILIGVTGIVILMLINVINMIRVGNFTLVSMVPLLIFVYLLVSISKAHKQQKDINTQIS